MHGIYFPSQTIPVKQIADAPLLSGSYLPRRFQPIIREAPAGLVRKKAEEAKRLLIAVFIINRGIRSQDLLRSRFFLGIAAPPVAKAEDVCGQHRQHSMGDEGKDPFQGRNHVLHVPLHPVPSIPDKSQPMSPIYAMEVNGLEVIAQVPVEQPTKV